MGTQEQRQTQVPFDRKIYVRQVVQNKVDKLLVSIFSDKLDEGLGR